MTEEENSVVTGENSAPAAEDSAAAEVVAPQTQAVSAVDDDSDIDSDADIDTDSDAGVGTVASDKDAATEGSEMGATDSETSESAQDTSEEDSAAEASDEPERVVPRRQSLVLRGGSCDMRVGQDAALLVGSLTKQVAGNPRVALLVSGPEVSSELVESCRRELVNTGYDVRQTVAPAGRVARNIAYACSLMGTMAQEGITADDPVVVVGDADLISGALYVTSMWYGGCILVAVPTTLDAMVEVLSTPRALDTPEAKDALLTKGTLRMALCDIDNLDSELCPSTRYGRAIMAATAMASSKNAFSDFAVASDAFLTGDAEALTKCIADLSKARSRLAGSSALAMRQSVNYGLSIARALSQCISEQDVDTERYYIDENPCEGLLLGEALRISARLAAAYKPDNPELVDLVFTQDGLLDKLGLPEVACVVDPEKFLAKLREIEFARANRFMLPIPLDYGRVRLTKLDDELLQEHLAAWCKSRRKLARRRAKEAAGE